MSSSCGTYYYIISGPVRHHSCISDFRLYTSKHLYVAPVAVKVFIPNTVKLQKRRDKEHNLTYFVCNRSDEIENFSPRILVFTYYGWKELFRWSSIRGSTIFKALKNLGWNHLDGVGFMDDNALRLYKKSNNMLFGQGSAKLQA